ncbi:MAG: LysM domain-containing protein [Chloroflexi bacterium]|nr:LysM domain-containing protein [Chloroflexota bacterium]
MQSRTGGLTRRRVIAGLGGAAAAALIAPRTLLASGQPITESLLRDASRSFAAGPAPRHIAWVWQFRHDGDPVAIRDALKAHGLGIALKTHDGAQWMSRYDPTDTAVSGARRVQEYADFFENGGVPFHAWAVTKGTNPTREAAIASDVLNAGARSLFLDLEAHAGFWVGTKRTAEQYGETLRRLQPSARLSTSIDPRPWEIDRIPLTEFASFTDEIAPQVYWDLFSSNANVKKYVTAGHAVAPGQVTPAFIVDTMMKRLTDFGRPVHPIGDGTSKAREAWVEFIDRSYVAEAETVSLWRYGVADRRILELLRDTPPRVTAAVYFVQPGDTLGRIAALHNTTVGRLVEANGIANPNLISVGQSIIVPGTGGAVASGAVAAPAAAPAAAPSSSRSYRVQRGDTLSQIAARHGVTTAAVVRANRIANPNALLVGQVLVIP